MDNKAICAVVVLAPMLIACGGGGGSGTASISTAIPAPLAAIQNPADEYESADVALTWTPPTQRADGSSLTLGEILGYQICYVGSDGRINLVDVPVVDEQGNLQTDWVLPDLEPDNYQFNIFTYDLQNHVSRPSATVALSIDTFLEL